MRCALMLLLAATVCLADPPAPLVDETSPLSVATEHIVAYYSFDGGSYRDMSGGGNDGTPSGDVAETDGVGSGAMTFDGANDYVETGMQKAFGDFTACVWFRDDGNAVTYERLLNSHVFEGFWMGRKGDLANEWGGGILETAAPYGDFITLKDQEWHFLCMSRSGTNKYIYGDGLMGSQTAVSASAVTSAQSIKIGVDRNIGGDYNGKIDEILIYSKALTASEVRRLYNIGLARLRREP